MNRPRAHIWGLLVPLFLGLGAAFVALMSLGIPMAILLSIFGTDPFSAIAYAVMSDRGTLAGVTGAAGVTLAMWLAHLLYRRIGALPWLGVGVAGYFAGAVWIMMTVPPNPIAG
ncbi:hypothetical protein sos41_34840 [Alphaproteobacteria bacterium SO-S41]|nr:hypothetical protein sos41_34840 [Alphaproteobacteria bacterium SO-S41]